MRKAALTPDKLPRQPSAAAMELGIKNMEDTNLLLFRHVWDGVGKKKQHLAEITCTACGATFYREWKSFEREVSWRRSPETVCGFIENDRLYEDGKEMYCPECGRTANVTHRSRISTDADPFLIMNESVAEWRVVEGLPVYAVFVIQKLAKRDGSKAWYGSKPYQAYAFEKRKTVQYNGFHTGNAGTIIFDDAYKQMAKCNMFVGSPFLEIHPGEELLKATGTENSHIEKYIADGGRRTKEYMRLWRKYPNVENLIMQGGAKLLDEILTQASKYDGSMSMTISPWIDLKQAKPSKMLDLTKPELRKAIREGWDIGRIKMFKWIKEKGIDLKVEPLVNKLRLQMGEIDRIISAGRGTEKTIRYLSHQGERWGLLQDYWRMMEQLGDLNENTVFPQHLRMAHDQAAERQKLKADEMLEANISAQRERLAKYDWQDAGTGLEIHACRTLRELYLEGQELHHCVYSYRQRYAEGKTALFFIREKKSPLKPFFTLELDQNDLSVIQNRGLRNCPRTDAVRAFEAAWLKHIKELSKEEKKNGKRNERARARGAA